MSSVLLLEGVLIGLSNFDLRESIFLLFGLTREFAQVVFNDLSDAGFDGHYFRFIKFNPL